VENRLLANRKHVVSDIAISAVSPLSYDPHSWDKTNILLKTAHAGSSRSR
jgi:hypothetical protein